MTEASSLDGAAFIVTGAVHEPGRTVVAALAGAGAGIAAVDDSQELLRTLAVEVAGQGAPGRVLAMAADLNQPGMGRRVVSRATLAFTEIDGLIVDAASATAVPPRAAPETPFWDYVADPCSPDAPVDVALALAAPAARQFRARGRGRLVLATGTTAGAALRGRIAGWAAELAGTGVTANLLLTGGADAACVGDAVCWLMSEASGGFSGRAVCADRWDRALPASDAAAQASGRLP